METTRAPTESSRTCDVPFSVKEIGEADDLLAFFRREFEGRNWFFRGHANVDWCLKSSLERYCDDFGFTSLERPIVESWLIDDFWRTVAVHDREIPPSNDFQDILALMQHYGAPTRLLDWSYSPFVATYFAIESSTGASAVWAINGDWLEREANRVVRSFEPTLPEPTQYDKTRDSDTFLKLFMPHLSVGGSGPGRFVYTVNPRVLNTRLSIQQGVFTAVGDVSGSFSDNLSRFSEIGQNLVKIVIQEPVGHAVLAILYRMGISRTSLYPGLDGFARSLRAKMHALRAVRTKLRFDPGPSKTTK